MTISPVRGRWYVGLGANTQPRSSHRRGFSRLVGDGLVLAASFRHRRPRDDRQWIFAVLGNRHPTFVSRTAEAQACA